MSTWIERWFKEILCGEDKGHMLKDSFFSRSIFLKLPIIGTPSECQCSPSAAESHSEVMYFFLALKTSKQSYPS